MYLIIKFNISLKSSLWFHIRCLEQLYTPVLLTSLGKAFFAWGLIHIHCNKTIVAAHDETYKMACAPSEDSDQPGHPASDQSSLSA